MSDIILDYIQNDDIQSIMGMDLSDIGPDLERLFAYAIDKNYYDLFCRMIKEVKIPRSLNNQIVKKLVFGHKIDMIEYYIPLMSIKEINTVLSYLSNNNTEERERIINTILYVRQTSYEEKISFGKVILRTSADFDLVEFFLGENYIFSRDDLMEIRLPDDTCVLQYLLDHGLDQYVDEIFDIYVCRNDHEILIYLLEEYGDNISRDKSIVNYLNRILEYDDSIDSLDDILDLFELLIENGFTFHFNEEKLKKWGPLGRFIKFLNRNNLLEYFME